MSAASNARFGWIPHGGREFKSKPLSIQNGPAPARALMLGPERSQTNTKAPRPLASDSISRPCR